MATSLTTRLQRWRRRRAHDAGIEGNPFFARDQVPVIAAAHAHQQDVGVFFVDQRDIDAGVTEQLVNHIGRALQKSVHIRAGRDDPGDLQQQRQPRRAPLLHGIALGVADGDRRMPREFL